MSSSHNPLDLIQNALSLLKEETSILASADDANYFRTLAKKKIAEPPKEPVAKQVAPKREAPSPPEPEPIAVKREMASPPQSEEIPLKREAPPELEPEPIAVKREMASPPKSEEIPLKREAPLPLTFRDYRSAFQKAAPHVPIVDEIPNDAIAKKIGDRWKTKNQTAPISILSLSEPPPQKALLEEIALALDLYFGPARIIAAEPIEKEKQWDALLSVPGLKLVIACDYTLWQLGALMRHYKELPAQGSRTLGNIPLFLLPDLSLYLKDPLLTRSLWKALCQKLSS